MNLFIVPSWYPSASNPSYGIFVKEQIAMMANQRPHWKIGVSTWGQGDQEKLLWIKDHVRNFSKVNKHGVDKAVVIEAAGFKEYYQPALSWTKKFRKGNLREIIRCNELNYQRHTLENGKPDVIMVQACYPGILIADYLSDKYDVPVHLHVRLGGFMFENLLEELGSIKPDLLTAISKAQLVTTTSHFHANEVQRWISEARALHNPVELDFFQLGESPEDYALAIGRLEEEKGFDLLIEAVSKIQNLKVKIVGTGTGKNKLAAKINSLDLKHRISLIGEADRMEIRDLIQKCQFLILPSRYETFGNVLLEAMACGKPVVATKCGGPEEILLPECGYLADINASDLRHQIERMVENLDTFNSHVIRKIMEERFSPAKWINCLEELLKQALAR
ncbi:glycosyltransferase [Ekhidna sp. To15]|uniref:glycosyltransferase n=1 Tax=Ekhidna sp. To15 TaxID=3395267 RepID=UPI003F51FAA3